MLNDKLCKAGQSAQQVTRLLKEVRNPLNREYSSDEKMLNLLDAAIGKAVELEWYLAAIDIKLVSDGNDCL